MKTKHQLFDATQELLHVQPKLEEVDKLMETVCISFLLYYSRFMFIHVADFCLLVYFRYSIEEDTPSQRLTSLCNHNVRKRVSSARTKKPLKQVVGA